MGRIEWQITHWISCLVSIEMRRADNGVTWMIWSWSTLPQKNDCWSDTKPGMSVSSTSSPFNVRTLKQQTARRSALCSRRQAQQPHISRVAHRVCPTNASTSVLSNLLDVAIRRAHIPLMPGRSMDACSWIPIPFRIIRREPSLYAPVTWRSITIRKASHNQTHCKAHHSNLNKWRADPDPDAPGPLPPCPQLGRGWWMSPSY